MSSDKGDRLAVSTQSPQVPAPGTRHSRQELRPRSNTRLRGDLRYARGLNAVMVGWPVLIRIVYLLVRRILGLAVLALCGDMAKDAELLVLRHENAVLRRHVGRVRYEPADRVWFAALARLIPRNRWPGVFPVTPATLLAWHRKLAASKYDTSNRRKPGRPPTVPGIARLVIPLAKENVIPLAKENPLWDTAGSTAR